MPEPPRAYAQGSQVPGTYVFVCPHCAYVFNLACELTGMEGCFSCPKCGEEFALVFAPQPGSDVQLHSELERAKPVGGTQGMRLFRCPYCGDAAITHEPTVLMGAEEEQQYVYCCPACGREYVRDLR